MFYCYFWREKKKNINFEVFMCKCLTLQRIVFRHNIIHNITQRSTLIPWALKKMPVNSSDGNSIWKVRAILVGRSPPLATSN